AAWATTSTKPSRKRWPRRGVVTARGRGRAPPPIPRLGICEGRRPRPPRRGRRGRVERASRPNEAALTIPHLDLAAPVGGGLRLRSPCRDLARERCRRTRRAPAALRGRPRRLSDPRRRPDLRLSRPDRGGRPARQPLAGPPLPARP